MVLVVLLKDSKDGELFEEDSELEILPMRDVHRQSTNKDCERMMQENELIIMKVIRSGSLAHHPQKVGDFFAAATNLSARIPIKKKYT